MFVVPMPKLCAVSHQVHRDDANDLRVAGSAGWVQEGARTACPYVFTAQRGLAAQICNLPYRRFVIGRASESSSALSRADVPQNAILRYGTARRCRNQRSADSLVRESEVTAGNHAGKAVRAPKESWRLATISGDTDRLQICATPCRFKVLRRCESL